MDKTWSIRDFKDGDEGEINDIFNSMNKYSSEDCDFDLTAARDNINNIPEKDRERVRAALKPYSGSKVGYAGFAVIDTSTYSVDESKVLRTRKNEKIFDVDLICLESFSLVARKVYKSLRNLL